MVLGIEALDEAHAAWCWLCVIAELFGSIAAGLRNYFCMIIFSVITRFLKTTSVFYNSLPFSDCVW